jgi:thiamine-phosphate pyrophosphorylase
VAEAAAGGIDGVYLRDADLPPTDLAALVREVRAAAGPDVTVLVNGGPEAAYAAAAGLHLREGDISPAAARAILGEGVLIGRAIHSAAAAATSGGTDYLLAGHVYPSASKPGAPPLGLAVLAAVAAAAPCPILAIGGITAARVGEVIDAGASGIAVIGAIAEADDPRAAAAELRAALDAALSARRKRGAMESNIELSNITLAVNGKDVTLPAGSTVHDFLAAKRMTDAMAIVERNGEIVPRGAYGTVTLQPGDVLEVVHAVGGG